MVSPIEGPVSVTSCGTSSPVATEPTAEELDLGEETNDHSFTVAGIASDAESEK